MGISNRSCPVGCEPIPSERGDGKPVGTTLSHRALFPRLLRHSAKPALLLSTVSQEIPRGGCHKKTSRLIRTGRANSSQTEREGFEPPSPFGRSLSRRVQYHSASAPERQRPDRARCASAGALILRNQNSHGPSVGVPGFEPGTSASRTQRSTGLSHTPNKKTAPFLAPLERTGWDSNPRDSIRCPHALQACALNHSATCPKSDDSLFTLAVLPKRRGWDSNPRDPSGSTP